MTQRRRDRERGLLAPKEVLPPAGVGRQRHLLDGHWPRAKTAVDSTLLTEAKEVIDDALSHADQRLTRKALTAIEWDLFAKGFTLEEILAGAQFDFQVVATAAQLTERQTRAIDLHIDGRSYGQIAEVMEISESGVRKHLRLGIGKLRELGTPPVVVGR